jgi:hypothetical protein
MNGINEYQSQFALRGSDTMAKAFTSFDAGAALSSDTWSSLAEKLESAAKMFEAIGAGTSLSKDAKTQAISKAATLTGYVGKVLADIARQKAAEAKAKEKQAAERKAFEKQLREGIDRSMRDHMDKVSRGEYRDPPTRETMDRIGRTA